MTRAQLQILINRHDPARRRANLSWAEYLHTLINHGVSFFEIVDLANYVDVGDDNYHGLLIALYTRSNNITALNRLCLRMVA